jgi:D-sedoheptulose 7-phosphate isomerase
MIEQTQTLNLIEESFEEHLKTLESTKALSHDISRACHIVSQALKQKGTILICGNGGSAADAQHLAGELVGRFYKDRRALSSLALHTNSTVMTAIGNDISFESVYSRQVEAHGREGDVLVAISTSGNSANILAAADAAKLAGIHVIGLTGKSGGLLAEKCDLCIRVPSSVTPRIQEMHILIGHIICQVAELEAC